MLKDLLIIIIMILSIYFWFLYTFGLSNLKLIKRNKQLILKYTYYEINIDKITGFKNKIYYNQETILWQK